MTTTVFDSINKKVTSDSRWSSILEYQGGTYLVFVDDSGFDKIVDRSTSVVALAGDGELISEWKKWLSMSEPKLEDRPPVRKAATHGSTDCREFVLYIVSKTANKVVFDAGRKLAALDESGILAVFSGSGMNQAAMCWNTNQCPEQAVRTAQSQDICSGGEVKFVDYKNGNSNLQAPQFDYNLIVDALRNRGMSILIGKANAVNDATIGATSIVGSNIEKAVIQGLEDGSLVASAPTDKDSTFEWTPAREDRLNRVLSDILTEEKQ